MSRADGHVRDGDEAGPGPVASQRLDKWLWFARLAKTRSQAAALVADGKIRLNRVRIDKPAATVKAGDVVTATVHRTVRVLKVVGFLTRRGPATDAARTFEELTPPAERTKAQSPYANSSATSRPPESVHAERPAGSGRPTKRERRQIDRFRDPSAS